MMKNDNRDLRQKLMERWGQLRSERASWRPQWEELSNRLLPMNGRYFRQDRNKGHRRYNDIYDNTGTQALRILGAGMMAGATSPARPWFKLGTQDPELNAYQPVKLWTNTVAQRMMWIFQKSNTYRTLHMMYEEMGAFGTAASILLQDFNTVIHHYPSTVGEYCIASDYQGKVNTFYREFEKTVAEVVREFGYENCSTSTQSLWDSGSLQAWVPIIHAIEPRDDRDLTKRDALNMPFKSCYFEKGGDDRKFLRESGYKNFPVLVPRWAIAGGDVYGNSPGMMALGDIKQLQHEQLRKAQCIDYQTNPPKQVPTSLKNRDVDALPGGITYVDTNQGTIQTMFEVNLNMQHLLEDIRDVRDRIRGAFYADLFLMLANATDTRMTATEVAERHEEKLLMLGPVVERLHNELLSPLIDITFVHMLEAGLIPPAPPELQGMDLNVEFVSMLAQAQRAIGTNSIDRFVTRLGEVSTVKPEVLDKFDSDNWVDVYSEMLGVDPNLIVADQNVALLRETRAQAQAAQAQAEALHTQSETARNLASAQTGPDTNALTDLLTVEDPTGL